MGTGESALQPPLYHQLGFAMVSNLSKLQVFSHLKQENLFIEVMVHTKDNSLGKVTFAC